MFTEYKFMALELHLAASTLDIRLCPDARKTYLSSKSRISTFGLVIENHFTLTIGRREI